VQPDIVLSAISVNHVPLLWARFLAGGEARRRIRVVVSQHNTLSSEMTRSLTFRMLPWLYWMFFGLSDAIVAVSHGVAGDLARCAGIAGDRITVIHNGVVDAGFTDRANAPCAHRWYSEEGNRIFLAVGRLTPQKDFSTLLKAFATMKADPSVKLIILGEGPLRDALLAEASSLGIAGRVDLPGFVAQPLPYMARAQALVFSSRYEGFGLVLAEALACGTQVVSTNCPHGPAEILDDGRSGWLVPVGNPDLLASAMTEALHTEPDRSALIARGQVFSISRCAADYLRLFAGLPHSSRMSTDAAGADRHAHAKARGAELSLTD
jgi:glycosyltransferase involved in cell wall biosynthesis